MPTPPADEPSGSQAQPPVDPARPDEPADILVSRRALTRAGEAPLIPGNSVTLLRDGPEVYGSWLEDIARAERFILFENYIFNGDRIGTRIAEALAERAEAGVQVFVLYDWFGCIGTSRRHWQRLEAAGAVVRPFNTPRLSEPIHAVRRDHRKFVAIDGRVAHVGGLCVGDPWAGDPARGVPPWRDTAVRIIGPAAHALCHAFEETWQTAGPPLPPGVLPPEPPDPLAGGAPVRVISGLPGRSRIYRIIQVLLSVACKRIWITDAYFLTPPAIYEALLAAARDGVDVRVLVPGRSDVPLVSWIGRSGYTGLLSAGVRIFEWEGPMLHAKTSVIDGLWSRVGSSNLNLTSLLTNWELDITIEDRAIGAAMEQMFLEDQARARELVLRAQRRPFRGRIERAQPAGPMLPGDEGPMEALLSAPRSARLRGMQPRGGRAGAAVARAGAAVLGAALRRQFEQSAWTVSSVSGGLLLLLGALTLLRPAAVGIGLAVLLLWLGVAAVVHAATQWWHRERPPRPRAGRPARRHLQQAKGRALSQAAPPPNQTEP